MLPLRKHALDMCLAKLHAIDGHPCALRPRIILHQRPLLNRLCLEIQLIAKRMKNQNKRQRTHCQHHNCVDQRPASKL